MYIIKEKTIYSYITDHVEISSDEDNPDEKILERIRTKKNSDEEDSSEKVKYDQKLPDYRRNYYLTH